MPTSDPRFPARFDLPPWEEDIARSTPAATTAAELARADYEQRGVPRSHLRPCGCEGRDGTRLARCFKVYLPQPAGRFGMVFTIDKRADLPTLMFLAFGVRHHPFDSHAPTVYDIADRRLLHGTTL
jgi:hypothetical protein